MCLPQYSLPTPAPGLHTVLYWPETALGAPVWAVEGITQLCPARHSKPRQRPSSSFSGRRRSRPAGGTRAGLAGCLLPLAQHIPTSVGMECVRTLWLSLTLALVLGSRVIGGHPQPCGVPTRAGASVRLAALLPRAPAARARVLAALTTPPPRLPYNLSLELVAVASPTRDPSSLARGLCQVLAPPGVVASIAFPEARPELRLLQFLAAATETPVLSVLRREVRAPLGAPVRRERGKPWGRGREAKAPHTSPTRRRRGPLSQPFPPKMPSARLG